MLKIVSGGQTGVDRAALDTALQYAIPCGGWCPEGRKAEDGVIPAKYPLQALPGGDDRARTLKNVQDSDGTVIIFFGDLQGGTRLTLGCCISEGKPYCLVDGNEAGVEQATNRIKVFYERLAGQTINIAGPRASENRQAYKYTTSVLAGFFELVQ